MESRVDAPLRTDNSRDSNPLQTFAEAAAVVVEQKRSGWRNPKHAQDWPASLERFVIPRFGQRSVSEVTGADILGVLAPIWHEKPETARRVRHRIGAVMQWAVAMEYRPDNPCERVAATLGRQRRVVRHMRALPQRGSRRGRGDGPRVGSDLRRQAGVRVPGAETRRGSVTFRDVPITQ